MIFHWALHKVKSIFLLFLNIFRRALCCLKKRRHSLSDSEPLTHVISNTEQHNESQNWSEWGDDGFRDKPKTMQDYIEQYRHQTMKARTGEKTAEDNLDEHLNFFEDMAPQITAQAKVLIRTKQDGVKRLSGNSRLNAVEDNVNVVTSGELGEWDETSGWDGEQLLDQEAQKVLREQKRLERERRAWEQHQKRLEKTSRTLGSKLAAQC